MDLIYPTGSTYIKMAEHRSPNQPVHLANYDNFGGGAFFEGSGGTGAPLAAFLGLSLSATPFLQGLLRVTAVSVRSSNAGMSQK